MGCKALYRSGKGWDLPMSYVFLKERHFGGKNKGPALNQSGWTAAELEKKE